MVCFAESSPVILGYLAFQVGLLELRDVGAGGWARSLQDLGVGLRAGVSSLAQKVSWLFLEAQQK